MRRLGEALNPEYLSSIPLRGVVAVLREHVPVGSRGLFPARPSSHRGQGASRGRQENTDRNYEGDRHHKSEDCGDSSGDCRRFLIANKCPIQTCFGLRLV
jgi:hypothetical protein